ncbi:Glyoxylase, beta-lactamase superfamily II [Dehalogenimonas formicexedens]|uniref:Glyoxylase, beta-lactamase superfamily II n=1 Tax=Dehalogenimonas formicexedens TaxID=1839801 RepID=A0A1P8FAG5_9CHLR|nr:MBL fold metallo-hydrolase [Dehalogenimonas formicexedens]APV45449.1 Glyoxylase, beta-lactamase superfamily II [Dehalogenimonas formicexedens]
MLYTGRYHIEVIPGVHWVRSVVGCNCWLVVEPGNSIVIDTGLPGNARRIVNYAKQLGVSAISHIILTHADIDHAGSASELKSLTGAKIAVHTIEAHYMTTRTELPFPFCWVSRLIPRLSRFARFTPDILLDESDSVGGLRVVHTPGHTPGSICLLKKGESIFTGDALRTHARDKLLTPSRPTAMDMPRAMDSMKKIAALDFTSLFGGHGPPVISKASAKLRDIVANLPCCQV